VSWLNRRWIAGAAAWAAVSLAIWFVGDALSIGGWRPLDGPLARLVLIAALGIAWLGWELWRSRKSLKENESLLKGLTGADAASQEESAQRGEHEVLVLRKRFKDALTTLRKARFRGPDGERLTVSQLPWYMFIGAPGSGKTTALLNAGLRFPLGDPRGSGGTLEGVAGTRNCDWWFTDEAVMVDTAGRYTTQDSDHKADASAWHGFLELLKRHRPTQPLNGVIVTLSISDLVHWNEEEVGRYAAHVRWRIWELYSQLGVRIPIYVMVTKADLLAGFTEYFGELDAEGRAQVWGTTFDYARQSLEPRAVLKSLQEELARLERRLYDGLVPRLQQERDLQRRAAIYRFPQQFRVASPLIAAFVDATFGAGWKGERPLLRGVYLSSGTQEGSPIDRVLGTLARSFHLERKVQPPPSGSGKSYFLRQLLKDVMFPEAGLAGTDEAREKRQRKLHLAAYASMAVVTLAVALAWTASFFSNRSLIASAEAATAQAKSSAQGLAPLRAGDEARLVAALSRLRELQKSGGDGAIARLGFYQGDKLRAQAERAYRNALRDALLPRLAEIPTWQLPEPARSELAVHVRSAQDLR
jgi:type VI secretion system protein ImpL